MVDDDFFEWDDEEWDVEWDEVDSRSRRCRRRDEEEPPPPPDEEVLDGEGEGGDGDAGTECDVELLEEEDEEEVWMVVEVAVERADAERRGRLTWARSSDGGMLSMWLELVVLEFDFIQLRISLDGTKMGVVGLKRDAEDEDDDDEELGLEEEEEEDDDDDFPIPLPSELRFVLLLPDDDDDDDDRFGVVEVGPAVAPVAAVGGAIFRSEAAAKKLLGRNLVSEVS